jgi:hypothetical protein
MDFVKRRCILIQRCFTKSIRELRSLNYIEHMRELQALTFANGMLYADIVFVHKCLHGKVVEGSDLGLMPLASSTRAKGCLLAQRHSNNKTSHLFCIRAVSSWNKLPAALVLCRSPTVQNVARRIL